MENGAVTQPPKVGKMIQETMCKVTDVQLGLQQCWGEEEEEGLLGVWRRGRSGKSGGSLLKLGQNPGEGEDVKRSRIR